MRNEFPTLRTQKMEETVCCCCLDKIITLWSLNIFLNSIISCSCECVFSAHISFIDKHPLFLALIILSSWPLLYIYLLHGWPCFDPRGYFKNGFSSFFYWKRENDLINKREAKGLWITRQKQKHERQVQAKKTLLIKPVLVARLSERRLSKLLGKKWYYYQWCS
jgi:hypothetical protein